MAVTRSSSRIQGTRKFKNIEGCANGSLGPCHRQGNEVEDGESLPDGGP